MTDPIMEKECNLPHGTSKQVFSDALTKKMKVTASDAQKLLSDMDDSLKLIKRDYHFALKADCPSARLLKLKKKMLSSHKEMQTLLEQMVHSLNLCHTHEIDIPLEFTTVTSFLKTTAENYRDFAPELVAEIVSLDGSSLQQSPPSTILLSIILKSESSEDIIANLEELYGVWLERHGQWAAHLIFYFQIIMCIYEERAQTLKKLVASTAIYNGIKYLIEIFKP